MSTFVGCVCVCVAPGVVWFRVECVACDMVVVVVSGVMPSVQRALCIVYRTVLCSLFCTLAMLLLAAGHWHACNRECVVCVCVCVPSVLTAPPFPFLHSLTLIVHYHLYCYHWNS